MIDKRLKSDRIVTTTQAIQPGKQKPKFGELIMSTVETGAVRVNKAAVKDADFKMAVIKGNREGKSNRDVRLLLDMSEGTFNVRMTKLREWVRANEPDSLPLITLARSERTGSSAGRTAGEKASIASLVAKLNVGGEAAPADETPSEPVAEVKTEESVEA